MSNGTENIITSSDLGEATFWLPKLISPSTSGQDALFYFIYYLSIFFFVVIVSAMLYFMWKYRKTATHTRSENYENMRLEVVWSVIPAVLFVVIFAWGYFDWVKLSVPPSDALDVKVIGKKWDWLFIHPKNGAEMTDLYVPVGKPVRLLMHSADVIHGFYVPDFRINKDVLPTQYTVIWFKAEKEGSYPILCTQYCGTKHSQMVRYIRVVQEAEYEKQLEAALGAGLSLPELGKKIFNGKGACASCHSVTPDKKKMIGPPLFGMYGTDHVIIKDKSRQTVKYDDNYIRASILNPNFRELDGYANVMPSYQGQLKDKEVDALIEYIKSLK